MNMNMVKGYSGLFLLVLGIFAILAAISIGIYDPRQYSGFAAIASISGVLLVQIGNLMVQRVSDE
jgi:hypothetical protein